MGRSWPNRARAWRVRNPFVVVLVAALVAPLLALAPASAATESGTVISFGVADDGRLGRAGGTAPAPVDIEPRVDQMVGGGAHSLARTGDGTVWSWGDNQWGQLGNGASGPLAPDGAPAPIVALDDIAMVAAGGRHSLAVRDDGTVLAWGDNTRGQLGRPLTTTSLAVPTPVAGLPIDDPVVEAAAGDAHTLVRTAEGVAYAWGNNLAGQVGPTPLVDDVGIRLVATEPVRIVFPDPSVVVVDISAGADHSIAVDDQGRVWTWGDNAGLQLGRPGNAQPTPGTIDVDGTPLTGVVQADGGDRTTVLRFADGSVARLGNGSATPSSVALPGEATDIASAGRHVVALVDESTEASAIARAYQWGDPAAVGGPAAPWTATPTAVGSYDTIVAIGTGVAHGFAVAAPRVTVSTGALDFVDAFGTVELFSATDPLTVTVTNAGPGIAHITSTELESLDFTVDAGDCPPLAPGESCDLRVVFAPTQIGPRGAVLRIDHDGFDPAHEVTLSGEASEIRGQIYVTTDPVHLTDGVAASPSQIPLSAIAVQAGSPAASDTEGIGFRLPLGDVEGIGFRLPLGDVEGIGFRLPLGDVEGIGFRLPLGDVEGIGFRLPLGDVEGIGFSLPLGDVEGINAASVGVLEQITLDRLPLRSPWRWDDADVPGQPHPAPDYDEPGWAVLTGSPALHNLPLQSVSLADVLRDDEAAERFRRIPPAAVRLGESVLGNLGIDAVLIGDRTLAELGRSDDWCGQLEAAGFADCGAGLGRPGSEADGTTASPFELQIAGVPLGALNLAPVTIGDLGGERVPANQLFLDRMPLYESPLGSIQLTDVNDPALVADCSSGFDCSTATVHDAFEAGRLLPAAQVGDLAPAADDLTVARLLFSLVPAAKLPFGATSLDDLAVKYYGDPAVATAVDYEIHFDNGDTVLPSSARLTARLPESFAYVPRSAAVETNGAIHPVEASVESDQRTLRWPVPTRIGPGQSLTLRFSARPGLTTGVFAIDEVGVVGAAGGITAESPGAPVRVVDAEVARGGDDTLASANDLAPSVLGSQSGVMAIGHMSSGTDVDLYRFPVADVPEGSELLIELAHQRSGDADVVLYGPADQSGIAPMRADDGSTPLTLTPTPRDRFDAGAGPVEGDPVLRERALVDGLPVLGLAQARDTADERLVAIAPEGGTGYYTVAVVPYDGAFSDDAYSLRVTVTPPRAIPDQPARPAVAAPVAPASGPVVLHGAPATAGTLVLTAPSRLADDPSVDLLGTLRRTSLLTLLGDTAILAVDRDPAVAAALAAWDAEPADAKLANDVVRAVNALVDSVRGPALTHLVLVGGDDVLPMGRVPDLTTFLSERAFTDELAALTDAEAANSVLAAAAANQVLSDDPYGDLAPTPIVGFQYLYVSDLAIGRLVETEADIVGMLDRFDAAGGELAPATALATSSADFLDDTADALADRLDERHDVTRIVTDAEWGSDGPQRLSDALAVSDVAAVNGHSDPIRTETASTVGTATFTSGDLAATGLADDAVLLAAGCHLLLPLTDSIVRAGLPEEFVQAGVAAGASSLTGNTGYGIGSRSTIGYTEALLIEFVDVLGSYDQGGAVAAAKRAYVAGQGALDPFDLKVVQELTHFGLPHLRYAGSVDPAPPTPLVDSAPAVATVELDLTPERVVTPDGSYYANPDPQTGRRRFISAPGAPVVPSATVTVGPVGSEVVGFMVDDARSFEAAGDAPGAFFDPVIDVVSPTGGTARVRHESQPSDVQFPANLWAAQANALRLATGLFRSAAVEDGRVVGSMTVFDQVRGRAYVAPAGSLTGDEPPTIHEGRALTDAGATTFVARVTDDVGVVEVSVLYREIDGGVAANDWQLVQLTETAAGFWTGGAAVASAGVETIFQARDTANQVTWLTNKARLTPAIPLDPGPFGSISMTVTGAPAPSNPDGDPTGWWSVADVVLHADVPITARVAGGQPFLVTGDDPELRDLPEGYVPISVRAADGSGGTFVVKVDRTDPRIEVFGGDFFSRFLLNEHVDNAIRCSDDVSSVATCEATIREPGGQHRSFGADEPLPTDLPGLYVLKVRAVDHAGNEEQTLRIYAAQYDFEGFLDPLVNLPSANGFAAGDVAPMKWRFTDANGVTIDDLDVIWAAGSMRYPCGWTDEVPVTGDGSRATGLRHDGDRYRFGWDTTSSYRNTCRVFAFVFDDASIRTIAFEF